MSRHRNIELRANGAARAVARDQICAANSATAAIRGLHAHIHMVAPLFEADQFVPEERRNIGKPIQTVPELIFQYVLMEGVTARITEFARGGMNESEAFAGGADIERAIVQHGARRHIRDEADGLHGAQGFVIDGDGARFAHRGFVFFQNDDGDARKPQKIG